MFVPSIDLATKRLTPFILALLVWVFLFEVATRTGHRANPTGLILTVAMIGIAALVTRRRPVPDLSQRAPDRATAAKEIAALWIYGAIVLLAGRLIGIHFFGEGIAMHLNGSLVGNTRANFRIESPAEVYTFAAYYGILLALIPYVVFRLRGYSNYALNLKSDNPKNDTLVILAVLAMSVGLDLTGSNIFQLTPHQQIVGGLLSFVVNLFGTGLPIMIFIYAILVPRYAKLAPAGVAYLLGAASYPAMHIFESWTQYDSPSHAVFSLIWVFLMFFPPGLMKSFLTMRTGNAWVHLWAYHAISPHVTVDTRLIVNDFHIV